MKECKSKVKVGNLALLSTQSLLVKEDEDVLIELNIGEKGSEDPLIIKIDFKETEEEKDNKKAKLSIKGEGDTGCITFINWGLFLNSSTREPVKFAKGEDGASIFFYALVSKSGNIYDLKIQFMTDQGEAI